MHHVTGIRLIKAIDEQSIQHTGNRVPVTSRSSVGPHAQVWVKVPCLLTSIPVLCFISLSIGLAVARRLAQNGARVTISSRKEANVTKAVTQLRAEGLDVFGVPCHVAKADQRAQLIEQVSHESMKQF